MVMAMLPAGVASGQTAAPPPARDTGAVCQAPYDSNFRDIAGSAHENNVRCMADYGLTEGLGRDSSLYGPRQDVTRGQMASFIARFIETYENEELPAGDSARFDDVPASGYVHSSNINKLAAVGVVEGTNASNGQSYAPQASVTRAQMASFIRRALSYLDDGSVAPLTAPPNAPGDFFPDDDGSTHEGNINSIAGVGIVEGFTDGTYRPQDFVKRDQMASFVMRAFDYAETENLGGDPDPGPGPGPGEPGPPVDPDPDDEVTEFNDVELSWFNELVDSPDSPAVGPLFGQGQVGATGTADLLINETQNSVTVTLDYSEVEGPFGAAPGFHLHAGEWDENGPVVVSLATGEQLDETVDSSAYSATTELSLESFDVSDIVDDPEGFYLNVHSDSFQEGAIRGQLPDGPIDLNVLDVAVDTVDTGAFTAEFTASDLDPDNEYRITLVPAANVAADGVFNSGVLFDAVGTPPDNPDVAAADSSFDDPIFGQPAVVVVNGELVVADPPRTIGGVSPDEDGDITFSAIIGDEDFHAFVYPEGGESSFLEVVGDNDGDVPAGVILELHGFSGVVEGIPFDLR